MKAIVPAAVISRIGSQIQRLRLEEPGEFAGWAFGMVLIDLRVGEEDGRNSVWPISWRE